MVALCEIDVLAAGNFGWRNFHALAQEFLVDGADLLGVRGDLRRLPLVAKFISLLGASGMGELITVLLDSCLESGPCSCIAVDCYERSLACKRKVQAWMCELAVCLALAVQNTCVLVQYSLSLRLCEIAADEARYRHMAMIATRAHFASNYDRPRYPLPPDTAPEYRAAIRRLRAAIERFVCVAPALHIRNWHAPLGIAGGAVLARHVAKIALDIGCFSKDHLHTRACAVFVDGLEASHPRQYEVLAQALALESRQFRESATDKIENRKVGRPMARHVAARLLACSFGQHAVVPPSALKVAGVPMAEFSAMLSRRYDDAACSIARDTSSFKYIANSSAVFDEIRVLQNLELVSLGAQTGLEGVLRRAFTRDIFGALVRLSLDANAARKLVYRGWAPDGPVHTWSTLYRLLFFLRAADATLATGDQLRATFGAGAPVIAQLVAELRLPSNRLERTPYVFCSMQLISVEKLLGQ